MNKNVSIYVGDLKYNSDSHRFVESWDRSILCYMGIGTKQPYFVDIDYLDLDKKEIKFIVDHAKVPVILSTLVPQKIDSSLPCQINYKPGWIKNEDENLVDLIKMIFHEPDRVKVYSVLSESRVSLFMINKWLQSNPTAGNMQGLQILDKYLGRVDEAIWISMVCVLVTNGPTYLNYHFRKVA